MLRTLLPSLLPALAALGVWGLQAEPAFADTASPGAFDDVAIADPADALTFARTLHDGAPRLLAVRGYRQGLIDAVDLSALYGGPVTSATVLFREQGYDA